MLEHISQINNPIAESELILNPDKSLYHIHLKEEHIAENVILVGDQDRVDEVAKFFDRQEFSIQNREFKTVLGSIGNKKITVISTGIGTDNIDIVLNELDAAVNIDLETRLPKKNLKKLNLIRLGTSGSLQEHIPVDSLLVSEYGLGFDGVLHFYDAEFEEDEVDLLHKFLDHSGWGLESALPYFVRGSKKLINKLGSGFFKGITATANGFYGPQGRSLRLGLTAPNLNKALNTFEFKGMKITNYEMETSALYGLGASLGHDCCTICAIIANRYTKTYSSNYKKTVNTMIQQVLERLTS